MKPALLVSLALLSATALLPAQNIASRMTARTFKDSGGQMPYRIYVPVNIEDEVPLILFLHGAGERGDDNEAQLKHGLTDILDWIEKTNNPAVVVAPQCPKEQYWAALDRKTKNAVSDAPPTKPQQTVMKLLELVKETVKVDRDRIYITGLSMGGYGTWDILRRHPETFAAAIPICGGGHPAEAREIKFIPIWIFHGAMDKAIPASQSRRMVKALEQTGATKVKYTEYPEAGHDSWSETYANPEVLKWMFAQKR